MKTVSALAISHPAVAQSPRPISKGLQNMDFELAVVQGRSANNTIKLSDGVTTIGRHDACQLRIKSSQVSRKHCEIFEKKGLLLVKDLKSSNGTIVNGKRIEGQRVLEAGDELTIGPIQLRVVKIGAAASAAKPGVKASDTAVTAAIAAEDAEGDDFALSLDDTTTRAKSPPSRPRPSPPRPRRLPPKPRLPQPATTTTSPTSSSICRATRTMARASRPTQPRSSPMAGGPQIQLPRRDHCRERDAPPSQTAKARESQRTRRIRRRHRRLLARHQTRRRVIMRPVDSDVESAATCYTQRVCLGNGSGLIGHHTTRSATRVPVTPLALRARVASRAHGWRSSEAVSKTVFSTDACFP